MGQLCTVDNKAKHLFFQTFLPGSYSTSSGLHNHMILYVLVMVEGFGMVLFATYVMSQIRHDPPGRKNICPYIYMVMNGFGVSLVIGNVVLETYVPGHGLVDGSIVLDTDHLEKVHRQYV